MSLHSRKKSKSPIFPETLPIDVWRRIHRFANMDTETVTIDYKVLFNNLKNGTTYLNLREVTNVPCSMYGFEKQIKNIPKTVEVMYVNAIGDVGEEEGEFEWPEDGLVLETKNGDEIVCNFKFIPMSVKVIHLTNRRLDLVFSDKEIKNTSLEELYITGNENDDAIMMLNFPKVNTLKYLKLTNIIIPKSLQMNTIETLVMNNCYSYDDTVKIKCPELKTLYYTDIYGSKENDTEYFAFDIPKVTDIYTNIEDYDLFIKIKKQDHRKIKMLE